MVSQNEVHPTNPDSVDLSSQIPLTTCYRTLFSKLKLVKDGLSSKLGDGKLREYLLQSVEGAVTEDGIPKECLEEYINALIGEERRLSYFPLADLCPALTLAMEVRKCYFKELVG